MLLVHGSVMSTVRVSMYNLSVLNVFEVVKLGVECETKLDPTTLIAVTAELDHVILQKAPV